MAVSIYDIAKKANVSPSTVSRALQDHPRIAEKTKQRIQALAQEMDYIPSTVAKSLIANRTWSIAMMLPTITDPFMGRIVEGVEHAAIQAGFNLILSTSQDDQQRELANLESIQQRRVDGLIVYASDLIHQYSPYVERSKLPVVVINEQQPSGTLHSVASDEIPAARIVAEHLIALGHRRIAYVGNITRPTANQNRMKGYRLALEAAGIAFEPALVFTSDKVEDYAEYGLLSVGVVLAAGATAVCCFNDLTAMGILAGCYQRRVAIPDDLSVTGFDDLDTSAYTVPPLTTIRQPRFELGQRAMTMILGLLDDQVPNNQLLPCELMVRQSTAPIATVLPTS